MQSSCGGGTCSVDVCSANFSDCDGNSANGCETASNVCYYSQTITIQNTAATALTNHQVRIDLPDTNPIFTPMHLANAAGNDIRIVQSDGTTAVPYWIETLNSGNAATKGRIWVNVTVPANSSIVLYLRYGLLTDAASPRSNIYDPVTPANGVMEWGDDFSGAIDTQPSSTRWAATIPATNIAALSGSGELVWKNSGPAGTRLRSVPTFGGSLIQESKFKQVSATRFGGGLHCAGFWTSTSDNFGSLINPTSDFYRNNGGWSGALPASADNVDYRMTLQQSATMSNTLTNYATNVNVYSQTGLAHTLASDPVAIGARYDNSTNAAYINQAGEMRFDWILVRKYAATLPTVTVPTLETAFSRSQMITVSNTGGTAQTNFQVRLQIGATNTDFWNNIDGAANATGHDIRIRDGLGADVSYWIEKLDTTAKVGWIWVKVPSIAAVATLRLFYGDGSLPAVSNITSTMIFGDEFAGIGVDVSKWTVVNGTGASVSGGQLHATSTSMRIQALGAAGGTVTTATQLVVAETRFRVNAGFNQGIHINGVYTDTTAAFGGLAYFASSTGGAGGNQFYYRDGGSWAGPTTYNDYSAWTLSSIVLRGGTSNSGTLRTWIDGSGVQTFTGTASYTPSAAPITLGDRYDGNVNADTGSADWEWIIVRKYAAVPPTLAAAGG
jgi:hypothetical protein